MRRLMLMALPSESGRKMVEFEVAVGDRWSTRLP
jgi:hypothetical protein